MRLGKVNAGHWQDSGSGPNFSTRYEFAEDCVEVGKVGISFLHTDGHPFHEDLTTEEILEWSEDEIKQMYLEEGHSENEAGNTASQFVRFRDWPVGTPVFFYVGRNTVYRVGYLKGEYQFEWDGDLHDPDGVYNHPHTRKVEWADVPELFDRKVLPDDFQGWLKNPQTVLDYDVDPGSDAADFLALAFGIGQSLSGLGQAELRILG